LVSVEVFSSLVRYQADFGFTEGTEMERIEQESSWNDPPTDAQVARINWYGRILNLDITEANMPSNRLEARNLIYDLRSSLRLKKLRERR